MPHSPVRGLPYSDIFNNVMAGFDQQLQYFFSPSEEKLTVVPISNDDALAAAAHKSNRDRIKFPFFGRRFNTIEERTGEWNNKLFRINGITLKTKENQFYQFRLLPINITVSINYLCLDEKDLYIFTQRWMDCASLYYLTFDLLIYDNPIRIRVECDPTITIPEFTGDDNTGNLFNAEVTATIHGFMGSITPIKTIEKLAIHTYQVVEYENTEGNAIQLVDNEFTVRNDGIYDLQGNLVAERPQ